MGSSDGKVDEVLLGELGARLRAARLRRNESQSGLAERAGVGKATLQRLEEGNSGTLVTFVRVLRALDLGDAFESLLPDIEDSPIEALRGRPQGRRRGGRIAYPASRQGWRWDDEVDGGR